MAKKRMTRPAGILTAFDTTYVVIVEGALLITFSMALAMTLARASLSMVFHIFSPARSPRPSGVAKVRNDLESTAS